MTMAQAAELRVKWKQRVDPPPCEHLNLELVWSKSGSSSGNYNCIVCGEPILHQQSLSKLTPTNPSTPRLQDPRAGQAG
jgi:hypothetical protein